MHLCISSILNLAFAFASPREFSRYATLSANRFPHEFFHSTSVDNGKQLLHMPMPVPHQKASLLLSGASFRPLLSWETSARGIYHRFFILRCCHWLCSAVLTLASSKSGRNSTPSSSSYESCEWGYLGSLEACYQVGGASLSTLQPMRGPTSYGGSYFQPSGDADLVFPAQKLHTEYIHHLFCCIARGVASSRLVLTPHSTITCLVSYSCENICAGSMRRRRGSGNEMYLLFPRRTRKHARHGRLSKTA